MGAKVKNDGILWFRGAGRLYATGYTGLGLTGDHRTGRQAIDVAGLRRLHAGRSVGVDICLHPPARAVLKALAQRYGWDEQPWPTGWGCADTPALQTGIGMEIDADGEIVVLPVVGGPDVHDCPEQTRPLDALLDDGLDLPGVMGPWSLWLSRHSPERDELRAVVEAMRGALR